MGSTGSVIVGPDETRREVQRVLQSHTFSRSDQLKRFLQYVCEKAISERADEISEYSIAVEALGRSADYSPIGDSSVRTRAHALRQKLQEYYELESPDAELRIEIPRGGYHPHFSVHSPVALPTPAAAVILPISVDPITPPAPLTADPPAPVQKLPGPRTPLPRYWLALVALALGVGIVLGLLFAPRRPSSVTARVESPLSDAWGPMLHPGESVDVCIATPPAMLLHSYKDGTVPPYLGSLLTAPKEVAAWYDGLHMQDGGGRLYMHTTEDVFLFGDSLAGSSVVQFLAQYGAVPQVVPESTLTAFALRGRNVVLIGSPNYSPLAARFLMNTPFSVRYDPVSREEVIADGPPEAGAKRVFRPARNSLRMLTKAFGLITVLPSVNSNTGGPSQTVIFSGITSAGPQAALEFFRSPDGLRVLGAKFRSQGLGKFPPAYQVVVRCGLDHNLALNWEYETHQVMQNSPLLQ